MFLLVLALGVGLAAPASAADTGPGTITCLATPLTIVSAVNPDTGLATWSIKGTGACVTGGGTLTIAIIGQGTSQGLGLCSGLVMQNFDITVDEVITRVFTGEQYFATYHFVNAAGTFPITSLFAVTQNPLADPSPGIVGAGQLWTHIFASCPPAGNGSATFYWTQQFKGTKLATG
jgi:hypothetical protein